MFQLSVCAETVFCDLPLVERARKIAAAGFTVDCWRLSEEDVRALAAEPSVRVRSLTGYATGSLVHPDGLATFLRGVEETLPLAQRLGCRDLVLSTGEIDHRGRIVHAIADHPITRWITAYKGLCQIAELAEAHDVTYHLEPLNTKVDHAGYPLPRVEDAYFAAVLGALEALAVEIDATLTPVSELAPEEPLRRAS